MRKDGHDKDGSRFQHAEVPKTHVIASSFTHSFRPNCQFEDKLTNLRQTAASVNTTNTHTFRYSETGGWSIHHAVSKTTNITPLHFLLVFQIAAF
jgi:hypothetical protein